MSPASPTDALLAGIAGRQFVTTRKGYDPNEVRGYLRELATLVEELQATEAAQRERAEQAEAMLGHPDQIDESRMVELLGRETARVLDAARVAAVDIRRKAEEAASRLISEANDEAHRLRAEAEAAMAAQRLELRAEVEAMEQKAATELARRQAEGEELVAEMRREAEAECDALRSRAQEEGRQMVTEAQVVRERMLRDLGRRRHAAREQLERLNAARDRLLAAYEVVRRTVDTATGELHVALPEAKVAGEAAMRRVHGEPEPSVEELDDLVAMARIAGLLDPRLEQSILDDTESDDTRSDETDEPAATDDADEPDGTRSDETDESGKEPIADDADRPGEVTGGRELVRIGNPIGMPRNESDDLDEDVGLVRDVVDVVAVEATVVDAADAVDALRELVVDDDPADRELGTDALDVDGRLLRLDEGQRLHLNGAAGPREPIADPDEDAPAEQDENRYDDAGEDEDADEASEPVGVDARWDDDVGEDDVSDVDDRQDVNEGVGDTRSPGMSVDELFAKLRAGRDEPGAGTDESHDVDVDVDERVAVGVASATGAESFDGTGSGRGASDLGWLEQQALDGAGPGGSDAEPGPATREGIAAAGADGASANDDTEGTGDQHDLLRQRDEALTKVEQAMARRLKRVLADEQNEVLDLLRRTKVAVVDADEVLPDAEAHTAQYVAVAREGLDSAATAGAVQVAEESGFDGDCEGLAAALGEAVVAPLRERIARSFVEAGSDVEELTGRLRSLYREWKAQRIGDAVRHFTVVAYAQGAYAAVSEGTPLVWLPDRSGDPCPDADDNALAGLVPRGEPFPTGDPCPPAHPGCRCLVAPAGAHRLVNES